MFERIARGDHQAFNALYDEFSERLYYFALRFVQQEAEAEDITAEAFIKLWSRKDDFHSMNAVAVFLHTTVRNRCLDYLKHEKVKLDKKEDLVRMIESASEADFSDEMIRMELMKKIYEEVDRLSPRLQEIFYLSYKEGLKPAQIAEKLDLSVQTVKNQRLNVIKLLKSALKGHPLLLLLLTLMEKESM